MANIRAPIDMNDLSSIHRTQRASLPRVLGLTALLILSVAGYVYSRGLLLVRPPEPPASATAADRIKLYQARIKADKTDVQAYVELGKLEESSEYYTSALRRFSAARALGAPEKDIILPVGRALSHLARWDLAIKELTAATRLMPNNVEAVANLAGAYFSSGSATDASRVLREFLGRHQKLDGTLAISEANLRRVMLCFSEARDQENAAAVARQILGTSPQDPAANAIAGQAQLLKGNFKEALPFFERSVASEPGVAAVRFNYAVALRNCGREDEAREQLERCIGINPNATEALLELGSILQKRGDWKRAAIAMSHAASRSPKDTPTLYRAGKLNERAGKMSEASYWYAKAALAAGQYQEAMKYASKLVSSAEPRWRSAGYTAEAEAYRGMHRMKEYMASVRKAAGTGSAQDDLTIAEACEKADLLEEQVNRLRGALTKDPRLAARVHTSISDTLSRRGLADDAEREMELAVAADPSDPGAHMLLGNLYYQRRSSGDRLRKALMEYQEAVRLNPQEPAGYQSLGIAYSASGDNRRAAFYLEHAVDLEPGYGPAYQELGRVYANMGDKASSDAMLGLFRKYVRYDLRLKTLVARADQNPKDPGAQKDLGDLQARSGDLTSALQNYGLALKLAPGDIDTRRKYDRLVSMLSMRPSSGLAAK